MPGVVDPEAAFPKEVAEVIDAVRSGCAAVIECVCGSGARAKDVSDAFGVHAKLGWQIWNVAYSPPLAAFRYLPNERGIKVWLGAAAERNVPADLIQRVEHSIKGIDQLIDTHAEDREMFEMLIDAHAEGTSESDERWRRQAFLGNSFTFGARAKCMLATAILYPSESEGFFNLIRLHGLIGLIRTRSGVRWPFASLVVQRDTKNTMPAREPLTTTHNGVPLMPRYCSAPLPVIERHAGDDIVRDELLPGQVGQTGASTIFTGEILHNLGPTGGFEPGETAYFGTGVRTPSELLISDHIVHRSLFPGVQRELRVFGELISSTTRDNRDRIEVSETLQSLGRGLHRIRTADVPDYAEMLSEAFDKIGFDSNDFEVFRVRMRYPPMPASVMVCHALPTAGLAAEGAQRVED